MIEIQDADREEVLSSAAYRQFRSYHTGVIAAAIGLTGVSTILWYMQGAGAVTIAARLVFPAVVTGIHAVAVHDPQKLLAVERQISGTSGGTLSVDGYMDYLTKGVAVLDAFVLVALVAAFLIHPQFPVVSQFSFSVRYGTAAVFYIIGLVAYATAVDHFWP